MKQGSNFSPSGTPPVKEGEVYTGSVDSVGEKGDGVVRIKGFVVFVPGVQKGDYIKFEKGSEHSSFSKTGCTLLVILYGGTNDLIN